MEVSSQLHALAKLPLRKMALIPTEQGAGWASEWDAKISWYEDCVQLIYRCWHLTFWLVGWRRNHQHAAQLQQSWKFQSPKPHITNMRTEWLTLTFLVTFTKRQLWLEFLTLFNGRNFESQSNIYVYIMANAIWVSVTNRNSKPNLDDHILTILANVTKCMGVECC